MEQVLALEVVKILVNLKNHKNNPKKRKRRRITDEERKILEEVYKKTKYPNKLKYKNLSIETQLEIRKIQVWFQNKRSKEKNIKKKIIKKKKYTKAEKEYLEIKFRENSYPNKEEIKEMMRDIEATQKQLLVWYQNRRTKEKYLS